MKFRARRWLLSPYIPGRRKSRPALLPEPGRHARRSTTPCRPWREKHARISDEYQWAAVALSAVHLERVRRTGEGAALDRTTWSQKAPRAGCASSSNCMGHVFAAREAVTFPVGAHQARSGRSRPWCARSGGIGTDISSADRGGGVSSGWSPSGHTGDLAVPSIPENSI